MQKSYIGDIQIIGDIYDEFTICIVQLVRILSYQASDYQHYSKLLPKNALNVLIGTYKLPLEAAFEIVRPSVKHISSMNAEEWR